MAPQSTNGELMRVIGRIESKIDGMASSMTGLHGEHKELKASYEVLRTRLQAVENRMYLWAGGVAVLSPIAFMFLKPIIERIL